MRSIALIGLIVFAVGTIMLLPRYAHSTMSTEDQQRYPVCGSVSAAAAAAVSQVIQMKGMNALSVFVNATGGNMGSTNLLVQVSLDNTANSYFTVDSIGMSSATIKGIAYSNALKATTVPVNPAAFPFVKVSTSAGVTSVTETLYWCAGLS